jgi:xylan 1,4-beta-xylosidase
MLETYKVGYRVNDPYTTYFDMGKPNQLTKEQVKKIKELNNGSAVLSEKIIAKVGESFLKEMDIHENDVFLLVIK